MSETTIISELGLDLEGLEQADFEPARKPLTGQRGYRVTQVDPACGLPCLAVWWDSARREWFADDHAVTYEPQDPLTLAVVQTLERVGLGVSQEETQEEEEK